VTRVVLDANFMRGRFSRKALDRLQGLLAHTGATIIVPEVVIWEWAEHAVRSYQSLVDQAADTKIDPLLVHVPPLPEVPDVQDLAETIIAELPNRYEVRRPSPAELLDAVRAQVQQVGAGERKNGTKTGAADDLIRATVKAEFDHWDGLEPIVLASADKNLGKVCAADRGEDLLVATDERELLERVIHFTPAESDLTLQVERDLPGALRYRAAGDSLVTFSQGFTIVSRTRPPSPLEQETIQLRNIEIVEVEDLKVEPLQSDGTRLATAEARIFGTVDLEVTSLRPLTESGDSVIERLSVNTHTMNGMIDLPITLTLDADWGIVSVDAAGSATIDFS
jgi:hypothetical protein